MGRETNYLQLPPLLVTSPSHRQTAVGVAKKVNGGPERCIDPGGITPNHPPTRIGSVRYQPGEILVTGGHVLKGI